MNTKVRQVQRALIGVGLVPSLLGVVAAMVLATGIASAAAEATGHNTIHGCARTSDGALRVVGTHAHCRSTEKQVVWSKVGRQGRAGHSILHGTTPPADAVGKIGDFYIDTSSHVIYGPKSSSGWPASGTSLVGPTSSGNPGTPGANGNTILHGSGAPTSGEGTTGDFYIDTTSHVIYGPKEDGSGWPASGTPLVGPAGAGNPGPPGTNGNTILHGSGAPTSGVGSTGDFYIDTTSHVIYGPKGSGGWPVSGTSIVGPSDIAIVLGAGVSVAGSSNAQGFAECPVGMTAVSGGSLINTGVPVSALSLVILDSANASYLAGGDISQWATEVHNLSATAQSYTPWAECVPSAGVTFSP